MGSRRYPGRRPLKGWQLTAMVGVAGALALAGCSSSGSSSAAGGSTSAARRRRHAVGHRLGHVGHDRVVGEPDRRQLARPTPGRC